jgi:ribosomal 50S subunit-associated protein YjgA (DUF615 family)
MLAEKSSFDLRTEVEIFEALGEWCVRVVERGEERVSSFVLQSYAEAFADGQKMRLGLDRVTRHHSQPG